MNEGRVLPHRKPSEKKIKKNGMKKEIEKKEEEEEVEDKCALIDNVWLIDI